MEAVRSDGSPRFLLVNLIYFHRHGSVPRLGGYALIGSFCLLVFVVVVDYFFFFFRQDFLFPNLVLLHLRIGSREHRQ